MQLVVHDLVLADLTLTKEGKTTPLVLATLQKLVAKKLGLASIPELQISKIALDTRSKPPRYVYSVLLELPDSLAVKLVAKGQAVTVKAVKPLDLPSPALAKAELKSSAAKTLRPVIVGAGPAGLFCALRLALAGRPPLLLERGLAVKERSSDVSRLYKHGILQPNSNICYGEGGAGAFSDGKLYTRIKDPEVVTVLQYLVQFGAKEEILREHRPHIGTNRLLGILTNLRAYLESLGVEYLFGANLTDIKLHPVTRAVQGVQVETKLGAQFIETQQLILATGHSAYEVWELLAAKGIALEARPFAVGFRIEHPQMLIDTLQYGKETLREEYELPAAEYRLTFNDPVSGRGVYSFCMCPGGVIVPTCTNPQELCINGMSYASRRGKFANSALVVTISLADLEAFGYPGLFGGVHFQRAVERLAYQAGGGAFQAPAQRVADFVVGRLSANLKQSSYRRPLTSYQLEELYPEPIITALKQALVKFNRQMPGFVSSEALLLGVETRTAAPLRLPRQETGEALGVAGLYPLGEGMGYGGGIVSAAVDGLNLANKILVR